MTAIQLELPAFLDQAPAPVPCREQPCLFDDTASNTITEAKQLCAGCPLMAACRDWARTHNEVGVWGGETDEERLTHKLRIRRRAPRRRPDCGTEAGAKWHRRHSPGKKPCGLCLTAETIAARERELDRAASLRGQPLTAQELEAVRLLGSGLLYREAAAALGIKFRLLQLRVRDVRHKLGSHDVVAAAREQGLLTAPALPSPPLRAVPAPAQPATTAVRDNLSARRSA